MIRAVITVRGFVQGVGYRRFTEKRAIELSLVGWVRNQESGEVQCCVEGERSVIDQLIERLRKGPAFSRVSEVATRWEQPSGEFKAFNITL